MKKIKFWDKKIRESFLKYFSSITGVIAAYALFWDIPKKFKSDIGMFCIIILCCIYFYIWFQANHLKSIKLDIEGSTVIIKTGDIFSETGLKVIAFNEYFDTQVDNNIISSNSLNGIFIQKYLSCSVEELDIHITKCPHAKKHITDLNNERNDGKKQKYELGTICVWNNYLLTAFSKFNDDNEAQLTIPEYLKFLINFWDRINSIYAQKSVSVPVFGSGITRIKGYKNINDDELLKIMLWTFKISEMRFKEPAKLTIIISKNKINKINLFEIQQQK